MNWLRIVLVCFSITFIPPGVQAAGGAAESNAQADAESFCERRLSALGKLNSEASGALKEMEALLAESPKSPAGKAKPDKPKPDKPSRPADRSPPPEPLTPDEKERMTVSLGLAKDLSVVIVSSMDAAVKALAEARRAKDPSMRQMWLKEAMAKLDYAEGVGCRLSELVPVPSIPPAGGVPTAPGGVKVGSSPTLHLLEEMKKRAHVDPAAGWSDVLRLSEPSPPKVNVGEFASRGTRFFPGPVPVKSYDAAGDTLATADGGQIRLTLLRQAVERVAPEIKGVPLLQPSPGMPGRFEPSPALLNLVTDPAERVKLEKVGGVALAVTFDLLARTDQPGFFGGGPQVVIRSPVLISLARLHQRLKPFAEDATAWGRLPGELRYPGDIGRLHGFIIDRQQQDVVLVGAPAEYAEARLDLDVLALALRAVWERNGMPAVSLDPLPEDMAGPQYSRVIDLPRHSIMARVMLDADYVMKRILFGDLAAPGTGVPSLMELYAKSPRARQVSRNRFWLTPAALRPNSLGFSPSGRTVLFAAGLQVLTENQRLADGALIDSGRRDEVAVRAAESFTRGLPALDKAPEVRPPHIFQRLQGLVDAVTLAKLCRELGLNLPTLTAFARLPYRTLSGADAVPAFYPGIRKEQQLELPGRIWHGSLQGGVSLGTRPTLASLRRRDDGPTARLEAAADRLLTSNDWLARLDTIVTLPAADPPAPLPGGGILRQASQALDRGKPEAARSLLVKLLRDDPLNAEAAARLAKVELMAGDFDKARQLAMRAVLLEPGDPVLRGLAFEVERRSGRRSFDPGAIRVLRLQSLEYAIAGRAALLEGRSDDAANLVKIALELWEDNGDAYLVRVWLHRGDPQAERDDIIQALRAYRLQASDVKEFENKGGLALALAIGATQRLLRLAPLPEAEGVRREAALQSALAETQEAIEEAKEAAILAPELPLAPAAELWARAERLSLHRAAGHDTSSEHSRRLAAAALARFPNFGYLRFAIAKLALAEGRKAEAEKELTETIRLEPDFVPAYRLRASLLVEQGRHAEARRDVDRAEALSLPMDRSRTAPPASNRKKK
jgi:tetratricopeptide (TPR) repeat protein